MTEVVARLKEALRAAGRRPAPRLGLPKTPLVARARVPGHLLGLAAPPPRLNRNQAAEAIIRRCRAGQPLERRALRAAPWCLWATRPAVADDPASLATVLTALAAQPRRQWLRALASAWLTGFEPARPGVAEAGQLLRRNAARMGPPWAGLSAALDLFDPDHGPRRVAEAALAARTAPVAVLRQGGIGTLDAASGYGRACLIRLLAAVEAGQGGDAMARIAIVRAAAVRPDGRLAVPDQGARACRALLRPFARVPPERQARDACLDLLLSLFGDPRTRAGTWAELPAEAETVHLWLTEQSLRQFLEVGDRTAASAGQRGAAAAARGAAQSGEADRIEAWRARRRFWEAVYDAGLVQAAWTVFGPLGGDLAKRAFGEHASFGGFQRGSRAPAADAGVLLLHLGQRGVIAEWTFGGATTIWRDHTAPHAPRFYQPSYAPDALATPAAGGRDAARGVVSLAHQDNWLARMAAEIHAITGVRIAPDAPP
ncbi:EH signature domain-containing protein [Xanthobacter sp. V4C-4]|uniref:EH signature domain-containing protein n=1 Tax=Xanthobacter cornucopiae TaxID=3119924 RepID=UPI00372CBBC9